MSPDRRQFLLGSAATVGAMLAPFSQRPAHARVDDTLEVMGWEGFTLEKETAEWQKATNARLRVAIMGTQDDVTAKLVGSQPVRLDVAEYSSGYERVYDELGLLKPIDISKIPNFSKENMFSIFYEGDMWYWNSTHWAIPYVWGEDTIIVRPDMIDFEITKYSDLLNPKLKGKLTFVDNPVILWPQIAKLAGYPDKFPNLTREEMDDAFEKLIPYREQARVFAGSTGDAISLFASGEIAACFCTWVGTTVETAKQGVKTVAIVPEERGASWVDAWFIPKTAENIDLAHDFINQSLTAEIQASITNSAKVNAVSKVGLEKMDPDTRAMFDYDNFDKIAPTLKIYGQPPRESEEFATYDDWLQKWSDFRSGF